MTPPVGACLFVMSSVTGERIEKISYALIPFLIVEVLVLFLVAFWDDLTSMFTVGLYGLRHIWRIEEIRVVRINQ